jgi:2,3-dihydroxybiphenyl 1,2-dioxygenase
MALRVGYWGFEVSDIDAWARFLALYGLTIERNGDMGFVRVDEKTKRIHLYRGPADDMRYQGWETDDPAEFEATLTRLAAHGVEITEGTATQATVRGVQRFACFKDPNGIPMEIACGLASSNTPYRNELIPGGFVTGEGGVGHIAAPTTDYVASRNFLCAVLDAKVSDYIYHALTPDVTAECVFLHTNPRHHSIAYAQAPLGAGKHLHHFMLEARDIADVGRAYDRVRAAGVPVGMQLGQHPNDRMVSFYAQTPSGFYLELGTGGLLIDDAHWTIREYDNFSIWGHQMASASS